MPTKILAIDTALNACSAALQIDTEIIDRFEIAPQRQSELILPMVRSLLAEASLELKQLDAIAFGAGPGSFTGVRLAASIVQGLCFGADLPAIPISTLRAIAQSAYREHGAKNVLVALDAHVKEIYWAVYACCAIDAENDLMMPIVMDAICHPEELLFPIGDCTCSSARETAPTKCYGIGDAWKIYAKTLIKQCSKNRIELTAIKPEQTSYAIDLIKLASEEYAKGRMVSAEKCLPIYLLEKNIYQKQF